MITTLSGSLIVSSYCTALSITFRTAQVSWKSAVGGVQLQIVCVAGAGIDAI